ncbi:hypothetical protein OGAPHI_001339 [Ogataea philodendri]|uniref:Xylanolytic transcriptional activator regulatory domain-containing protein n=1 Tax=Ogataea philodendri TaxID=1378263 RepID=A0A9P8PBI0_9ASCO|nr:uncharacterized protein OGAPHI_001339 [Ogataea philodendri]KAH3669218.1 hypothetical protein OGAPHI_001339 [Ogataea philodendri]
MSDDSDFSVLESYQLASFGRTLLDVSPKVANHGLAVIDQEICSQIRNCTLYSTIPQPLQSSTKIAQSAVEELLDLIPEKTECDLLVKVYLYDISWCYRTIHFGSFWEDYKNFWRSDVSAIKLDFLALLLAMLTVSSSFISPTMISADLNIRLIRELSIPWYNGCRQAMHLSKFEYSPTLLHLQAFSVLQTYFHARNDSQSLHLLLGQAVAAAQQLGLHRLEVPSHNNYNHIEFEIKKRLWWDLCSCDSFQAVSLSRPPLIRSVQCTVPMLANAHDSGITRDHVEELPLEKQPTYVSVTIYINRLLQIFNTLWNEDGEYTSSLDDIIQVDQRLDFFLRSLPWYLKFTSDGTLPILPEDQQLNLVHWQFHYLWSCAYTQKLRMHRVFLSPRVDYSFNACEDAVQKVLQAYNQLKMSVQYIGTTKFLTQGYQIFSASIAQAIFILVEKPRYSLHIKSQVKSCSKDLELLASFHVISPVVHQGTRILRKLLQLLDRQDRRFIGVPKESGPVLKYKQSEAISKDIYPVFGGLHLTQSYVRRASTNERSDSTHNEKELFPISKGLESPASTSKTIRTPDDENYGEFDEHFGDSPTWDLFFNDTFWDNCDWGSWNSFPSNFN